MAQIPGVNILGASPAGAWWPLGVEDITAINVTDRGSGNDVLSQVVASLSISDIGAGDESLGQAASTVIQESGIGVDTVPTLSIELTITDTAIGQDLINALVVLLTVRDTAVAIELLNIIGTKSVKVQDVSTSSDSVGGISVSVVVGDIIQAIDIVKQVLNSITVSDTGAGIESISTIDFSDLPKGYIRVTFTTNTPTVEFDSKESNIDFSPKKPKIIID